MKLLTIFLFFLTACVSVPETPAPMVKPNQVAIYSQKMDDYYSFYKEICAGEVKDEVYCEGKRIVIENVYKSAKKSQKLDEVKMAAVKIRLVWYFAYYPGNCKMEDEKTTAWAAAVIPACSQPRKEESKELFDKALASTNWEELIKAETNLVAGDKEFQKSWTLYQP